jgi:hypothetical protein
MVQIGIVETGGFYEVVADHSQGKAGREHDAVHDQAKHFGFEPRYKPPGDEGA